MLRKKQNIKRNLECIATLVYNVISIISRNPRNSIKIKEVNLKRYWSRNVQPQEKKIMGKPQNNSVDLISGNNNQQLDSLSYYSMEPDWLKLEATE